MIELSEEPTPTLNLDVCGNIPNKLSCTYTVGNNGEMEELIFRSPQARVIFLILQGFRLICVAYISSKEDIDHV